MCGGCGKQKMVIPTATQVVRGIVGIGKLVNANQRVDDVLANTRRNHCRNCEFSTRNEKLLDRPSKGLTNYSQCQKCACVIVLKTLSKDEKCPIGKW